MEKNITLAGFSYQNLIKKIVAAVRRQAQAMSAFRDGNGCVRITTLPLCRDAIEWSGGFDFSEEGSDVCISELVFPIHPAGSYVTQWVDPEDGHSEPVNCYAYSALKTAWMMWKQELRQRKSAGETFSDRQDLQLAKFFTEDNGWAMQDGSVCLIITRDNVDFCQIYICTSGAKSVEDRECSMTGALVIEEVFASHKNLQIHTLC